MFVDNRILKFIHHLQVFISIHVITVVSLRLSWVVRGCERGFAWVACLLINISWIGVKVRVGLEKIIYKIFVI